MRQRIQWIDNTKIFACILVVLGHFFQSMTTSGILPQSALYTWFNRTIYQFHVPLFFICSGFLYQRYTKVTCFPEWRENAWKKLLALGIPYLFFSVVTWGLKSEFKGEVNVPVGNLTQTLLVNPISPYWYLYALLFCFLLIPTIQSKGMAVWIFAASFAAKTVTILGTVEVYGIQIVLSNVIWFVLGTLLAFAKIRITKQKCTVIGTGGGLLFLASSVMVYVTEIQNGWVLFLSGLLACGSVIVLMYAGEAKWGSGSFWKRAAGYTMPVFLMHTLCAAPVRQVLFKIGITNAWVHIPAGLISSFAEPVLIAILMRKTKYPEFVMYPGKFLNKKR